ncbi:MAG: MYXO-CTERM sorting domain-containing protein, partial [Polyangiaceae bacterium]
DHALELRLLGLPTSGRSLDVEVRFAGEPLPGAKLVAYRRDGRDVDTREAKSDGAGRASFEALPGEWLVRSVHMIRCEGCDRAEWESFWSAYSFSVAPPASPIASPAPSAPPRASGCAGCATGSGGVAVPWWLLGLLVGSRYIRRRRRAS